MWRGCVLLPYVGGTIHALNRPWIHTVGVLPVGSAEVRTGNIEGGAHMNVSLCECIPLEFVPLGKLVSHTFSTKGRKERVTVLKAMSSILELLRSFSETNVEVSLRDGKVWRRIPKLAF